MADRNVDLDGETTGNEHQGIALSRDPFLHLEVGTKVDFDQVVQAERNFHTLVSTVAQEAEEQPVRWLFIESRGGDRARFRLMPESTQTDLPVWGLVKIVVDGVVSLGQSGERPAFFNDHALEACLKLVNLGEKVRGIRISNGTRGVDLEEDFASNVKFLIGTAYTDFGSVEGRLKAVSLHKAPYFNIYDELTGKATRCEFGDHIGITQITQNLTKRVSVSGVKHYRSDGQLQKIEVEHMEEMEPTPGFHWQDAVGILA